ncbi:MAG: MipA/OmpV family protein [Proteobacteria bacterium]|nr:MipA/OmpV family protein [Pseudomonadota bacterium]
MNRMLIFHLMSVLAALLLICDIPVALSIPLPQWEWGISYIEGQTPHYFGSNHYYHRRILFPYFNYRTSKYQFGDSNKLYLWRHKNQSITFDLNGRLPVESSSLKKGDDITESDRDGVILSDENTTRRGMPDLPLVLFTGVKYHSYFNQHFYMDLSLMAGTPLGVVYTPVGAYLSPSLNLDFFERIDPRSLTFSISWLLGDQNYNRFYYDVPNIYVLAERPFFRADSGLVNTNFALELSFRIAEKWKILAGFYNHLMENSVIKKSPLVVSENSLSLGIIITYVMGISAKKVTLPKQ